jgi:hypothetical protein
MTAQKELASHRTPVYLNQARPEQFPTPGSLTTVVDHRNSKPHTSVTAGLLTYVVCWLKAARQANDNESRSR